MENLPVYDVYVLRFMNTSGLAFLPFRSSARSSKAYPKQEQSPIPRDPAAQPPASLFWTHNKTFHCEIVDTSMHSPGYPSTHPAMDNTKAVISQLRSIVAHNGCD